MTEAEWLAADDLKPMLALLQGKASDRKLRLFACACCRRIWHLLADEASRTAVELAERYADGTATATHRTTARAAAKRAVKRAVGVEYLRAAEVAWCAIATRVQVRRVAEDGLPGYCYGGRRRDDLSEQHSVQSGYIRCILGNPFRLTPPVNPAWLAWNGGTVRTLAEAAYEERQLPEGSLDTARLALLADGLEDAGCGEAELLGHLRGPGPHVRGCWALDLLLGKG
jgi:hypothetical protein